MIPTSVIALFCEDIREEKSGLYTLIGIMPDNLEGRVDSGGPADGVPAIPKLAIYVRLQFDPRDDLGPIKSSLTFPTGEKREIDMLEASVVETARKGAIEQGNPIAAVFSRMQMVNFPVLATGRLTLEVTIKRKKYLAGSLHLKALTPSASEPPQPS